MPETLPDRQKLAEIDPSLGRGTRLPLAAVLLGVVLLVALLPLLFFNVSVSNEMRETLTAGQEERLLRLATSAAQRIDAAVDKVATETIKIGQALGASPAGSGTVQDLSDFLDETVVLARFTPVAGAAVGAKKPELVVPVQLEQSLSRDAQAVLDAGPAPTFAAARAAGHAAVRGGPFVIGPERVIAFTVTAAVQRQGALLGVYQEIAVLQRPWEEANLDIQAPTKLFLLRSDGSVIRHTGTGGPDESAQEVRSRPVVQHFVQQRGRFRGTSPYTVPGLAGPRRMLGGLVATAAGWGVLVEVDEKIALAPVAQMSARLRNGALLAAGLALAAALLLRTVISRPITRLAQISKRLADGDFSVLAAPSRITELDLLGVNFNRMAGRLGELVERFRSAAREANDMFLGTIRALAEAIDEKDPYTKGHSVRVNRYAVIIGRYLGLSREEMRHLQISSLLHDVGKIGIDDAILKKPAALSPEEFGVMKTHPERGAKIMGRIPQMRNIIPGMRFHHERYSGGGYPLGLQKEEIPLQARIIAVADTLDAMITDRPYQKALPVADAVARINDLKGRMLDPQVVEAFNRAFEAGEFDDLLAPPVRPDAPEPEAAVAAGRPAATGPDVRAFAPPPIERRP